MGLGCDAAEGEAKQWVKHYKLAALLQEVRHEYAGEKHLAQSYMRRQLWRTVVPKNFFRAWSCLTDVASTLKGLHLNSHDAKQSAPQQRLWAWEVGSVVAG